MTVTETESWLNHLRRDRERIQRGRARVAIDTKKAVLAAGKEGIPKTRIAELAGISRQTVHEMLKD